MHTRNDVLDVLKVNDAARLLGVKDATIRAWVLRRKIPYFRAGRCVRFKREWIERIIAEGTVPAREAR